MKQTACFVSSLSSASDEGEDDGDVLEAMKQIVSERAKLKAKVQVNVMLYMLAKNYTGSSLTHNY